MCLIFPTVQSFRAVRMALTFVLYSPYCLAVHMCGCSINAEFKYGKREHTNPFQCGPTLCFLSELTTSISWLSTSPPLYGLTAFSHLMNTDSAISCPTHKQRATEASFLGINQAEQKSSQHCFQDVWMCHTGGGLKCHGKPWVAWSCAWREWGQELDSIWFTTF